MTQMLGKYRMYEAWGKFDRENDKHHPLAHHCMDDASVFARMTRLPVVRDRLEKAAKTRLDDVQCTRLSALVFLHDIGKLHPGFQAKGWPPELWPAPKRGHLREGWAFLHLAGRWPEHPFHEAMRRMLAWGEAVGPLLAAAIAHHGRPVAPPSNPTLEDWDSPVSPKYDWRAQARSLQGILIQWFAEAFEGSADPLPNQPRFHHAVAGLAALADWIGSDRRFFNYVVNRHSILTPNRRAKLTPLSGTAEVVPVVNRGGPARLRVAPRVTRSEAAWGVPVGPPGQPGRRDGRRQVRSGS